MCGIAGFTHADSSFLPERIYHAVSTVAHRGPDQQGIWQNQTVSLGATRLKVIDRSAGSQPMSSDGVTLVFNGEIYNHVELRNQLIGLGHRFTTACDTEVVLHAFIEWDTACIEKLRGMFAFAVWGESRQRLVLARDRMGIKPLYYARRGRDIYFGSEMKTIFCHPEVRRSIDLNALALLYAAISLLAKVGTLVYILTVLLPALNAWFDKLPQADQKTVEMVKMIMGVGLVVITVLQMTYPIVVLIIMLQSSVARAFRQGPAQDVYEEDRGHDEYIDHGPPADVFGQAIEAGHRLGRAPGADGQAECDNGQK